MFCFLLLIAGVLAVFLFNVGMGSADITVREIFDIISNRIDPAEKNFLIIWRIRLPRALASISSGAAIGISGFLLQTYFSNPIVESYVLGISSGSSLFVGIVILSGFTFGVKRVTPIFLFLGAFIGAMIVMLIILFAASRVRSIVTLLIVGLMAGYVCSAATSILAAYAEREQLASFTMWNMGSFAGFTWQHINIMYAIILPMLVFAFLMAKSLNVLHMGDKYAKSMGVNVKITRYALIIVSSVLTAAVTAFAGPISL